MMMTYLHCNQRLSLHLNLFNGEYFHTNPYQALRCKQWNTNKENYSRTKSESDKIRCNNQILASSHPDDNEKSKASCQWNPPANHHTNVWIQVFPAAKTEPSLHNSSIPPGSTCRAVCLLSSSLVQVTVERGTSILVTNKVSQLPDQMPNLGRQIEEKLV